MLEYDIHGGRNIVSRTRTLLVAGAVALVAANAGAPAHAHDHDHLIRPVVTTDADWAPVVAAIGRTGKLSADGTSYKVGFPRRDLTVTSYRVAIKPSFALAGNASFARYPGGHAMLMGDLVVTEAEAPAVTDALQAGGIAQTAIHKHLLAESPPLWWMHIGGMGDPAVLARAVKAAIDKTATPPPAPPAPPGTVDLDTAGIDAALGGKGTVDGGVYKFTFARHETITEDGHVIPPGLGVTTALNFQPLGGGRAAINGDFAMTTARSNMSWPRCAAAGSPSSRCTTTPWTTTRGCSTPTSGPRATASSSPGRSAPAWTRPPSCGNHPRPDSRRPSGAGHRARRRRPHGVGAPIDRRATRTNTRRPDAHDARALVHRRCRRLVPGSAPPNWGSPVDWVLVLVEAGQIAGWTASSIARSRDAVPAGCVTSPRRGRSGGVGVVFPVPAGFFDGEQGGESAVGGGQFGGGALFDDAPGGQHDDPVGVAGGG